MRGTLVASVKMQRAHHHRERQEWIHRHAALVRVTHWITAIAFFPLLVSGIAILIAHPELYWGEVGYFGHQPAFSLGLEPNPDHTDWGRNLHFLFAWILVANGMVYVIWGLVRGHFRHNLSPTRQQLEPRHLLADLRDHLRFRTPKGDAARRYGFLQKVSYLVVIFMLCPLMLVTGLAMSPGITAAIPELLDLFGGRQSARTLHFVGSALLVVFLGIHLFHVILAGPVNEVRSMIIGKYVLPSEDQ